MRFSLVAAATIAGYASLAAAQDCNPSFNVTAAPQCIADCNKKAGQEQYADWTDDPSSPNFIQSMGYQCGKGTPAYTTFMTSSGTCMMSCSKDDQNAFTSYFADACSWYNEHSKDTCETSESLAMKLKMGGALVAAAAVGSAALLF
ncbi:hypothetical protein K492DRAFT_122730 [Lichtheimia hyalospora FSU 10163]|nr:hypothetical protein K492DRAFT_122730 [Lichtheimia hyalospora FSU 10163]